MKMQRFSFSPFRTPSGIAFQRQLLSIFSSVFSGPCTSISFKIQTLSNDCLSWQTKIYISYKVIVSESPPLHPYTVTQLVKNNIRILIYMCRQSLQLIVVMHHKHLLCFTPPAPLPKVSYLCLYLLGFLFIHC